MIVLINYFFFLNDYNSVFYRYYVSAEDNTSQVQWKIVDNEVVLQKAEEPLITINVRDSTGKSVAFKVTMDTLFKDIFAAYAEKEWVALKAVRFIHDGSRISGADTPNSLDMIDNCFIDVTIPQSGGSWSIYVGVVIPC